MRLIVLMVSDPFNTYITRTHSHFPHQNPKSALPFHLSSPSSSSICFIYHHHLLRSVQSCTMKTSMNFYVV
ncbi:hypothetical protein QVD17_16074 [Tagetes erecta]|uniref:Uncharacterized protein n=1 Tax=Tagetes erecta TaxID=13708 RepID=A0AAD8KUC4_TARER|nr:hypothetical protein QVD17_16074 [Tagetes erecta]